MMNLDSYEQFFKICSKDTLFQFGLDNIISIEENQCIKLWNELKQRINNRDDSIYIRSSGRNGVGNNTLLQLYKDIFNLSVRIDPSNNQQPTKLIETYTGYKKNHSIFNYQVAHVFGNTKNIFCFTAPWNIVFIPKIIDPFTGHESKGKYVEEFQKLFQSFIYQKYKSCIDDYNSLMENYLPKINLWLSNNCSVRESNNFEKDFSKIDIH